jgi:hypothetical protein
MKSTKYQLLKDDFDHACNELKIRNETIKDLRKKLDKIRFLKHCFYGDRKQLHNEIDKIINVK